MSDNEFNVALNLLNVALIKLQFVRTDNAVCGYLYEYYGTESKNIKSSALIKVDENYTSIISNKRETDDLVIEGYMEVYNNENARLVGCQVKETVKKIEYDTMWYNLWDISGIRSIKALNEMNGDNLNTIYINGNAEAIHTKLVGGVNSKSLSRRFDIEMKDLYFYKLNVETNKYEKVKMQIPMLFIQSDFVESFANDFYDKNKGNGMTQKPSILINNADKAYVNAEYTLLIDTYKAIKKLTTYASIK